MTIVSQSLIAKALVLVAAGLISVAALADGDDMPMPLSVEDNMRIMDANHDGMVSVSEVRAYLEAMHGKNYEKSLLDEIEAKATGKSCASPFTRSFY